MRVTILAFMVGCGVICVRFCVFFDAVLEVWCGMCGDYYFYGCELVSEVVYALVVWLYVVSSLEGIENDASVN